MSDQRIRILIIEDEAILAMGLSDLLEDNNFNVVGIANNGRKAIEIFLENSIDFVLSDIRIKGEFDGIETVKELLSIKQVPIIYMTSFSDRETIERAKQTFPAAFIAKPVNLPNLMISIEMAFNNFHAKSNESLLKTEPTNPSNETILQIDDNIFVKNNYQFVKINLNEILFLEADSKYTTIQTTSKKYALRLSISSVLERINFKKLFKIHRSFAINIDKVDSFNDTIIKISNYEMPLSRNFKDDFLRHFQQK